MANISLLILTHSEYSDIWFPLFDRFHQFLSIRFQKVYVCCDKKSDIEELKKLYPIDGFYIYTDNMSYPNRMKQALSEIQDEYVLIWHDSNILTDFTDVSSFEKIQQFLGNADVDQLRLHAGSCILPGIQIKDDIYKMRTNDPYLYCVYPTIWKKSSLMKIFYLFPNKTYRQIEDGDIQSYVSTLNNYYVWNLEKCPPRGCAMEVRPHIIKYAKLIVTGRWTMRWDELEITSICNEYHINFHSRGINDSICYNSYLHDCYLKYKQNHVCHCT